MLRMNDLQCLIGLKQEGESQILNFPLSVSTRAPAAPSSEPSRVAGGSDTQGVPFLQTLLSEDGPKRSFYPSECQAAPWASLLLSLQALIPA